MLKATGSGPDRETADVVVVGGGLAGLTAAALLARAGRRVTLYEKSRSVGGRAITQAQSDFHFNLGPHALYRAGAGTRVLRELGIAFSGGMPRASGGYAVDQGVKHTLPGGFVSLLSTGVLRLPGKFEFARLLTSLPKIDTQAIQHLTVRQWSDSAIRQPDVRRLLLAFVRLATYANDPSRQSAGAALAQLQMAVASNVTYLNGGWQVLVDGLRAAAEASGVRVETSQRVEAIAHDAGVRGVRLADGTLRPAACVVVAASPSDAAALVAAPHSPLHAWAEAAIPVRAACLDVGLRHLPQSRATFALGVDRPLYFSVHSAVAQLAPQGGAVVHVAKYLEPEAADSKSTERELEGLLDLIQPGWRDLIVERRFLPNMIVSHALATAAAGGCAGRPGPAVPGIDNLYVVGDWVGAEGWLADASLASARQAAALITQAQGARCGAAA